MLIYVYKYLYLILLRIINDVQATINILDHGILPLEKNSIAIQFYIDIENVDRSYPCKLHSKSKRCCLMNGKEKNCNIMSIYGENTCVVQPKDRETMIYVYPTLYQHDQIGSCNFVLEYRCNNRMLKRQEIDVPFDTMLNSKTQSLVSSYVLNRKTVKCDTLDEDSLNDCNPVDCDLKYSGKKPFYDTNASQCVEAPICNADPSKDLPDVVYVPKGNTCRDLDYSFSVADILAISSRLGVVTESTNYNDTLTVQVISNCSTISQNLNFLLDMIYGKLMPILCDTSDLKKCSKKALLSIVACIAGICAVLFAFVCCVNTVIWLYRKWTSGKFHKFFKNLKSKFKTSRSVFRSKKSHVDTEVRNTLLREVILRDLPLEMRNSRVDVCDRMSKVRWKKKYRSSEIKRESQVNLLADGVVSTTASTVSVYDED